MDKPAFPTVETEKMLRLPVGAISPLWLMFAGAATVGAAWYWSRTFFRPTNLEALFEAPQAAAKTTEELVEALVEAEVELVQAEVEAVEAALETVVETVDEVIEAAPEPVAQVFAALAPEPVAPAEPDDLTVLTGIGPKLAAALAERGVTRFAQIAAWTDEDIAGFDKELKLMGRIGREAWIAQARRFAEG
jgi:predicted flap endonuclease-1-like 5' DNA nuclease